MINQENRVKKKKSKIKKKQESLIRAGKFKRWKSSRPFWGATMILLAGLLILYIPIQLYAIAFAPGSFAFVGLLFGGLILIIGGLSYVYPSFSTVFGVMAIFLSVLSVMGALGGFVVGTILGIIGGALCVGWKAERISMKSDRQWSGKAQKLEGGKLVGMTDEKPYESADALQMEARARKGSPIRTEQKQQA
ncbi:MAG TPA: DUF6114 domain-containing protein [Bacillales bacterium]|nr:DUF6114 domain-containing protein [Bacillales bacterium]